MFINKNFSFAQVWRFSGHHLIWILPWMILVAFLYEVVGLHWLSIPWLPLSVIGTAVAFYVGFKNNSAYDRMWEARKIWGAIINSSRSWGASARGFVTNHFSAKDTGQEELDGIVKVLLYRHIGWLYALRSQLLIPTPWEHLSQGGMVGKTAVRYRERFGVGLINDEATQRELKQFLPADEYERLINYKNTATQIIDQQSQHLKDLRHRGIIDDFRHMELQKLLNTFYDHQGKCERIKKFPLPRQYANMSFIFIAIFVFLLPFGMVGEFAKIGEFGVWLSIPFSAIVAWVYVMMELVGDYSENPFEGLGNDIPMLSLCRVIEIDLREMLGETELPPAVEAVNGVLM